MKRLFRLAARVIAILALIAFIAVVAQYWRTRQIREALWAAFTPVQVTNCELQRFGPNSDGGYPLCVNLLPGATSTYSYGIAGYDPWGCVVAEKLNTPLHQYDCFDTTMPVCAGKASPTFHAECIGPERATIEGRPFDTLANQVQKNGDAGKRLIVKMDVEGSEWESLRTASDEVLKAIDQMAIEFHEIEESSYLETAARLNQFFYVVNRHQNNHACLPGFDPFPGPVFEVLLVNKRIAVANPSVTVSGTSRVDAPNTPIKPDCQASPGGSEPQRITQWMRRNVGVIGYRLFGIPFS